MQTLKQKFAEVTPILLSLILAFTFIWLIFLGVSKVIGKIASYEVPKDTRTIQEVKEDEYKSCIKAVSRKEVLECANYLK